MVLSPTHPISIVFQACLACLEFWAIGQVTRSPLRFSIAMVVLNVSFCIFNALVGVYIISGVCAVMAWRHLMNVRRILRSAL